MSNGKDEHYLRLTPHPKKCKGRYPGKNKPARKKIRQVSKKMREKSKIYAQLRNELLTERPVCQCWLAENGFIQIGGWNLYNDAQGEQWSAEGILAAYPEAKSTQCHHKRGRGRYYLAYDTFMAVSEVWHRWIEDHKDQAIAKGWLHPEKNRRPLELPARGRR